MIFIVLISQVTYVGFTIGALAAGFLLCIVPTIGALLFGIYSPKAWCAVCPTGTILKVVDPGVLRVKKKGKTVGTVPREFVLLAVLTHNHIFSWPFLWDDIVIPPRIEDT
ncbi:MAG: hypothetical protein WA118_14335 [Carboxydocellales bacterium]